MTKSLRANIFHTVLGKVTFNNRGDMKQDGFVWYQWHNGKYLPKVFKKKPAEIAGQLRGCAVPAPPDHAAPFNMDEIEHGTLSWTGPKGGLGKRYLAF